MPPVHLNTKKRYDGGITDVIGQDKVFINGLLAAVEGDISSHGGMGQLIQQYGKGNIIINGLKMIVAMGDRAAPDMEGMVQHPTFPTDPLEGASNVFAYADLAGGGLGAMFGGKLNIGELVSIGGQVIGTVKNFIDMGGGQGQVILQNLLGTTPQAGQTLVGQDSGTRILPH